MQRRAHVRYAVGFGADVHTDQGVISASTRDVSRGGCQLRSGRPIREGVTVRIELSLTVDGIEAVEVPSMSVQARIQWVAEGEEDGEAVHVSGVRFESLTAAQADWLEAILRQRGRPGDSTSPVREVEADIDVDIDLDM